ncbi:MAG: DUF167 domain-containing protein [Proteobacteria bacterium]|nr:DUF167 domain-containing protein [Pseudomonadota bacterium]
MTGGTSPFQRVENGVVVSVRLTPKASCASIEGIAETPGGGHALRVKVTAAPEKGRANAALLKLLAEAWGVAPSRLSLVSGHKDRRKRVLLEGDPTRRMSGLQAWLAARHG